MVVIPAGSFTMGSPQAEPGHQLTEAPQHNVTIEKSFAVSKFVVTFVEWDACAAHGDCVPHVDDHGWGRDRQPVINVSWDNAQRYVTWLSKITGKTYRLLTEAEYEYAARADTRTAYPWAVYQNVVRDNGRFSAFCRYTFRHSACGADHHPFLR